jgi:hypothetical protein
MPFYRCSPSETTEGGMARHRIRAQRDLFAAAEAADELPAAVRGRLLSLLAVLLQEVTTAETAKREGGDEQDRP